MLFLSLRRCPRDQRPGHCTAALMDTDAVRLAMSDGSPSSLASLTRRMPCRSGRRHWRALRDMNDSTWWT